MKEFEKFIVTGVDVYGKRFRLEYTKPQWAFGINLFSGSVWGVCKRTGKRKLLKRVH